MYKKREILSTEDFSACVHVDEWAQVCLHLEVFNWCPRVAKELRKLFTETKEAFRLEGFSTMYAITPTKKFINMTCRGGEELEESMEHNNVHYDIIVWDLGD